MSVCVHECVFVCVHECVFVCVHECVFVCVHECVSVCVHGCVFLRHMMAFHAISCYFMPNVSLMYVCVSRWMHTYIWCKMIGCKMIGCKMQDDWITWLMFD